MGYPGHVNCTENFNGQVTPFGIAHAHGLGGAQLLLQHRLRRDNVFVMDEPWSRPGDYVLLRAMSDLVCASSACPDDIDPANGWQITPTSTCASTRPTTRFSVAIAHRVTPDAEPGAHAGDDVPSAHERADEELRRVPRLLAPALLRQRGRDRRVLGVPREGRDHGPLAAAQVGGPRPGRRGAASSTRSRATRGGSRSARSRTRRVCNETGGMIDDATVYRLGQDNFRFVGGDEYDGIWLKELRRAARAARCGSSPRPTSSTTSPSRGPRAASS